MARFCFKNSYGRLLYTFKYPEVSMKPSQQTKEHAYERLRRRCFKTRCLPEQKGSKTTELVSENIDIQSLNRFLNSLFLSTGLCSAKYFVILRHAMAECLS